jgi:hypothetical protein
MNIDDYTIGMSFISWLMAMLMLMGFSFLKFVEADARNENSDTQDNSNHFIDDYNGRNFAGRVVFTLVYGTKMMSVITKSIFGSVEK